MVRRRLALPAAPSSSFFLWGPRQTGKTSLLRELYPDALWIDLLKTDLFIRYSTQPSLLREELLASANPRLVVIDEIQKVPVLLDEVHWLIENWVFHELSAHRSYSEQFYDLSYWRLASGIEVDFVIGDMEHAVEAKATVRVTQDHLRGLREVARDHRRVKRRILVCLDNRVRRTEDGIDILPAREFVRRLWSGEITV